LIKLTIIDTASKILRTGLGLLGQRNGAVAAAHLAERLSPVLTVKTESGTLHFFCPGHVPFWQAENLLAKEPETIEWIDTFAAGEVFWDIGANVGAYTLYAALNPDLTVLAFEPAAVNYYVLNRNIEINKMDNRIATFCLAFNDDSCLDYFHMPGTEFGEALHSFARPVDWQNKPFTAEFRQTALGFSIDDFVDRFTPPFPNHIKVDVDGNENRIIQGGEKTLSDKRLKSLLVELNTDRTECCRQVIARLEEAGLEFHARKHASMFESGPYASVYNHIFIRS
jgi:FkbM family methyltransferase